MQDTAEGSEVRVDVVSVDRERASDGGAPQERTVVVIAGAGARGAYEAGAMAVLLPGLLTDLSSTILLGTSAGAINAALWGSRVHDQGGLAKVGDDVKDVWRSIHQGRVFRQPAWTTPSLALRAAGRVAKSSAGSVVQWMLTPLGATVRPPAERDEITGLLDTAPLWDTARDVVDFHQMHRNVQAGKLLGIGVVATSCPMDSSGGRSRVFLDADWSKVQLPEAEPDSSIDYVKTESVQATHVLASAAIPIAFPAVHIRKPADYAGWYTDGGVRLNAPIEPAIKLGATRIIVISSHSTTYPRAKLRAPRSRVSPDILDVGAQSVHAVLADGMIEDLKQLHRINEAVEGRARGAISVSPRGRAYRRVEVLTVSPKNGKISPLAREAVQELGVFKKPTYAFIGSLLSSAADGAGSNELLSYLLFEPSYFGKQFERGAESARRVLAAYKRSVGAEQLAGV